MGALLLLVTSGAANACTVCGCTASNQYLGILPQSFNNFIGIQYQYRYFNSIHDELDEHGQPLTSTERYNTMQLWGKYNIGRVQLFAFVPYVFNEVHQESITSHTKGIGDVSVLANGRILGNNCSGKKWQHSLQAGAGIKLPTGAYDDNILNSGELLPNMLPGTASWDVMANANYTLKHGNGGVNVDISYTATTVNKIGYKYGNRLSTGILGFYSWQRSQVTLLPQAGMRLDVAGTDYESYEQRLMNDMSGGGQLYAAAGVQAYYRHFGAQLMGYQPVSQHYAGGMVKSKARVEAGLYFLF